MVPPSHSTATSSSDCIFDLLVIGSGPAGQRAALQAAKEGKKVAVVERYPEVGGACIHFGTIPSKSFRESVYRYSLGSRGVLGREADESETKTKKKRATLLIPEMTRLLQRKDRVVRGESAVIRDQLKRNGISVFHGEARFLGPAGSIAAHPGIAVEVVSKHKRVLSANKVMIAVGARPVAPAPLEIDARVIHDSDTVLELTTVPKSMVVLGAGVIGCEYASMFAMAGTKVTLVDKRDRILGSVDREIVQALSHRFESLGMEIVLKAEATKIDVAGARKGAAKKKARAKTPARSGATVHLSNGRKIRTETVLVAMGRLGNTEALGLETVGIAPDERGLIKVDSHFRTSASDIYAVGDVVGAPALAATAMEQGRIACCHAFGITMKTGSNAVEVDHEMPKNFPYGIYTIPEISMIGKTEEEVKGESYDYVVGRARYRELARGQIVGDRRGQLKLIVDRKTLRILGVHIVGDNAADLIHIGQAVMAFNGDVTYFINSVFNYPTLAEAYKTAAFNAFNVLRGRTSGAAAK
jgi:NAD(P) transhydrogenase